MAIRLAGGPSSIHEVANSPSEALTSPTVSVWDQLVDVSKYGLLGIGEADMGTGRVRVTLDATNIFGKKRSTEIIFQDAAAPEPNAFIVAPKSGTFTRSRELVLGSYAAVPECLPVDSTFFTYQWRVYPELYIEPYDKQSRTLTIPKFATVPDGPNQGNYQFDLEVTMQNATDVIRSVILSQNLTLVPSRLEIKVTGGDKSYPHGSPFVLDGSGSFDPDNSTVPMTFVWSCVAHAIGTTTAAACPDLQGFDTDPILTFNATGAAGLAASTR